MKHVTSTFFHIYIYSKRNTLSLSPYLVCNAKHCHGMAHCNHVPCCFLCCTGYPVMLTMNQQKFLHGDIIKGLTDRNPLHIL